MLRHMKKHHPNAALPIIPKINNATLAHQKIQQVQQVKTSSTSTATTVTSHALPLAPPPVPQPPPSASQPVIQYHHHHHPPPPPPPQSHLQMNPSNLPTDNTNSIRGHHNAGTDQQPPAAPPSQHHQQMHQHGLQQIPVTIISSNGATNMSQQTTTAGNQLPTDHTVVY